MTFPLLLALSLVPTARAASPAALGDAGAALQNTAAYDGTRARAAAPVAAPSAAKPLPEGMLTEEQARALRARLSAAPEPQPLVWPAESQAAAAEAPAAPVPAPGSAPLRGAAGALAGLASGALLAAGFARVMTRAA